MMGLSRGLVALALLVLLLAVACGSGDDNGEKGKNVTLGDATFADHGTKDVKGKDRLELEVDSTYFAPTFVHGDPGQKVKLTITNESATVHNFTLTAQQIDKDIAAKGKMEIEVTLPQSGALWFFCKYHSGQGMNGELLAGNTSPQPVAGGPPAAPSRTPSASGDYGY